jgi:hypothetical protein
MRDLCIVNATHLARRNRLLASAPNEMNFNKSGSWWPVTCQINKDTNSYYTTPICIYSWIIINALRQKMLSWGMGIC